MLRMQSRSCFFLAAVWIGFCCTAQARTDAIGLVEQQISIDGKNHAVRVPEDYRLELLTSDLDGPRLFMLVSNGDFIIGSKSGNVYRLPPPYTRPEVLVTLDDYPHSIGLRRDEMLIAQTNGVYRTFYKPGQTRILAQDVKLLAPLPSGGGHSSRSVGVGPDGRIYASIGISGNCNDQYLDESYPFDERRGGMLVLREDGKQPRWETYASGLRNPVGFSWHPQTGELYASNNGPDHWGYDQPPEYFSRLTADSFHGMPWFQFDGKTVHPDNCIKRVSPRPLNNVVLPVATFAARSAPMGVSFVPTGAADERLEGDAVVAIHGSWATQPSGGFLGDSGTRRPPKIVVVRFDKGKAQRVDDLVTGFQASNGKRWARPIGVVVAPDGAIYFTSDSETEGLFRLKRVQ